MGKNLLPGGSAARGSTTTGEGQRGGEKDTFTSQGSSCLGNYKRKGRERGPGPTGKKSTEQCPKGEKLDPCVRRVGGD